MPFRTPWRMGLGGRKAVGEVVPWYLSGGIASANCIIAYQPKGAANLAASYINLITPGTNDAAEGTAAPTWDATSGWIFTGASSQYLIAGSAAPLKTWSVLVRFSNNSGANGRFILGAWSSGNTYFGIAPTNASGVNYLQGSTNNYKAPSLAGGVLGLVGSDGYRNGSLDLDFTDTVSGTMNRVLYIGTLNNNGSPAAAYITAYIQAVALYDTTLTAPQVEAVSTAMAAL